MRKLAIFFLFIYLLSCGKNSNNPNPPPPPPPTDTTTFKNPLLSSGPDPWVAQKDGNYYYTETQGNKISIWKTQEMQK